MSHPYCKEQETELDRWGRAEFGREFVSFYYTVEVFSSRNDIATFYVECFVVYRARGA